MRNSHCFNFPKARPCFLEPAGSSVPTGHCPGGGSSALSSRGDLILALSVSLAERVESPDLPFLAACLSAGPQLCVYFVAEQVRAPLSPLQHPEEFSAHFQCSPVVRALTFLKFSPLPDSHCCSGPVANNAFAWHQAAGAWSLGGPLGCLVSECISSRGCCPCAFLFIPEAARRSTPPAASHAPCTAIRCPSWTDVAVA